MSDNSRCPECGNTDPVRIRPVLRGTGEIIGYRCIACGIQYDAQPGEPPQRRAADWQPIETRPDTTQPCWIGRGPLMVVARPSSLVPGTWRTLWGDTLVQFQPTHWQKLPEPPEPPTAIADEDLSTLIPLRQDR